MIAQIHTHGTRPVIKWERRLDTQRGASVVRAAWRFA
jgi:hypothetical protein